MSGLLRTASVRLLGGIHDENFRELWCVREWLTRGRMGRRERAAHNTIEQERRRKRALQRRMSQYERKESRRLAVFLSSFASE